MSTTGHVPATFPSSHRTDGDGNLIQNEILRVLPAKERKLLLPKLEFVRLKVNQVLYEPGDTLKSVYFCNAGMISVLSVFPDGKSVGVGLVGKEGFLGSPLIAGFYTSPTRAVAQIDGSAFRMDGEAMVALFPECPELLRNLFQCSQISAMQIIQIAACSCLHGVHERLARCLLMSAERISSDSVPLTQEFLGLMLGTRRSSVTIAAGLLQRVGIIAYGRGNVKILDRSRLEETACECYRLIRRQEQVWQSQRLWGAGARRNSGAATSNGQLEQALIEEF